MIDDIHARVAIQFAKLSPEAARHLMAAGAKYAASQSPAGAIYAAARDVSEGMRQPSEIPLDLIVDVLGELLGGG